MNYWPEYVKRLKLAAVSDSFAAFRLTGAEFLPPVPGDATLSVKARMMFPRYSGEEWFPQDFLVPLYVPQKIACSATRVMIDGVELSVKGGEQYVIVDARYAIGMIPEPHQLFADEEEPCDETEQPDDDLIADETEGPDDLIVLTVPPGMRRIMLKFED